MTANEDWRQKFVGLLSSAREEDWDRALAMRLAHIPATLFRYRRPAATAVDNLQRGTILLSAANKFNDLFDTSVRVDFVQNYGKLLRQQLANGTLALPPEMRSKLEKAEDPLKAMDEFFVAEVAKQNPEAAERAKNFFRTFNQARSEETTARCSEFFQRTTKVACFCESGTLPALWAYYAEDHKGFCVEYPFSGLPRDDFRVHWLLPVVYTSQRFNLSALIERLNGAINPFGAWLSAIHKSPDWAHEQEWRIVDTTADDLPGKEWVMPTPSRILLGYRMEAEWRRQVAEIARAQSIPVFEVSPSRRDQFELDVKPVV